MSKRDWLSWDYVEKISCIDDIDILIAQHQCQLLDLKETIERLKKIRKVKSETPSCRRPPRNT